MTKLFIPLALLCLFAPLAVFSQNYVDESKIEAKIENGRLRVEFPASSSGRLTAEVLDSDGLVVAKFDGDFARPAGRVAAFFSGDVLDKVENLRWLRLHYKLVQNNAASDGIVALSRVTKGLFVLRSTDSGNLVRDSKFNLRVAATNLEGNEPQPGVALVAKLTTGEDADGNDVVMTANAVTGADGAAEFTFAIAADAVIGDEPRIEVRGTRDGLVSIAASDVDTLSNDDFFFTLDKPLYQPGQKVQFRALALRSPAGDSGSVIAADREVGFQIKDENDLVLARVKARTSRFGIASGEWTIPPNARLGRYSIEASIKGGSGVGAQFFTISRYELPNFIVRTKTDREFYLPSEQTAEVTVSAEYLFGKPVVAGHVRVVRESNRRWSYAEQKWKFDEGEAVEGEADANGNFVAVFNLANDHKTLAANDWRQSDDTSLTAYFTDPTSNRTEERRFDLRISKTPVHVYLDPSDSGWRLPNRTLVQTVFADGTPCACAFEIFGRFGEESDAKSQSVARGRTDRNGLGVVDLILPPQTDDSPDLRIFAKATADDGRSGQTRPVAIIDDGPDPRAEALVAKTLHLRGEPIDADVFATGKAASVLVDVVRPSGTVLFRRRFRVAGGRARVRIPATAAFSGKLVVRAWVGDDVADEGAVVVYPSAPGVELGAAASRAEYRPGEDATLDFNVRGAVGNEAALGVVVLDRAVEERARIDSNSLGGIGILAGVGRLATSGFADFGREKPTPEMQTKAASEFFGTGRVSHDEFDSTGFQSPRARFARFFDEQFANVGPALKQYFAKTIQYPKDAALLRLVLARFGVDFGALRDPWARAYRVELKRVGEKDRLTIVSGGADKIPRTSDDVEVFSAEFEWFRATGIVVDRVVAAHYKATGELVRDRETLKSLLAAAGVDLDAFTDPDGRRIDVQFDSQTRYWNIRLSFMPTATSRSRVDLWTNSTDFFSATAKRMGDAVQKFVASDKRFPKDEAEFRAILKADGIDFDDLRGPAGAKLYIAPRIYPRFANRRTIGADGRNVSEIPVTQIVSEFRIRTENLPFVRYDSGENTWDRWVLATFSGVVSEQTKDDAQPKSIAPGVVMLDGYGGIAGVVTDANGGLVPGARVTILRDGKPIDQAETDDDGEFYFSRIEPWKKITLSIFKPGFKVKTVDDIFTSPNNFVGVKTVLEVGAGSAVVDVTADSSGVFTTQMTDPAPTSEVLRLVQQGPGFQIDGASGSENVFTLDGQRVRRDKTDAPPVDRQSATPRLRQYFPETLLWVPEVVTGADGKTSIRFKLGDNITTWNVYAVASDAKGRVGLAKTSFKAFQPFFVDLDPPKFLTAGDEIFLPTQVRNYTDTAKKVDLTMARADWFETLGADRQTVAVEPNETANGVFGFRAKRAIDAGRQRVTALAGNVSDAVEKQVTVRPDGEQIVGTETRFFYDSDDFDADFPATALPGTASVELKIYPNPIAHVTEAVDGLLMRPYGCGEQTISLAYPNLMLLKFASSARTISGKTTTLARRNLRRGYDRLLGYQSESGGFTYWGGRTPADVALTAYALRFLLDAGSELGVENVVIAQAREFLVRQQKPDGRFGDEQGNEANARMIATYVARALGKLKAANLSTKESELAASKALKFAADIDEKSEPYTVATLGLASLENGDSAMTAKAVETLRRTALREGDGVYWSLETNTPFYGWGRVGRIESTALALQLLIRNGDAADRELISSATAFLLKNKDAYGVWFSTQTTINVLDALLLGLGPATESTIDVSVDGVKTKTFTVGASDVAPLVVNFDSKPGARNRIGISASNKAQIMAQIVKTHYVGWNDSISTNRNVNTSRAIRFDYGCDKLNAKIAETVTCRVDAERIGFRGYGMLLAEIGIPPGAEVSRESLERAPGISNFEVLPDRIVVYMWAVPGGTKFDFTFKPRYAIKAKTPASVLYDYYNEEARATVAPLTFEVAR